MKLKNYHLENEDKIISPAMIYHRDAIIENCKHTIELAGGDPGRLWYHVKTHKTRELVVLMHQMGITHFMAATIAEAEMTASTGVEEVLIAYQMVGPNIERFVSMAVGMPKTRFWTIGDDVATVKALSDAAVAKGIVVPILLDVNVGQNRTGILLEDAPAFFEACKDFAGIQLRGMHCYDGHNHQINVDDRQAAVNKIDEHIEIIRKKIEGNGFICDTIIVGGTPSYPCHAKVSNYFLSPGTSFVMDARYGQDSPDLELWEAGAILTRVVSLPSPNTFTVDLGSKGISCDQSIRGEMVGVNATPVSQSEEHWVWKMDEGHESERPNIGDVLYVIPYHVCPSTVLYDSILVAEGGKIVGKWETVARKRQLYY